MIADFIMSVITKTAFSVAGKEISKKAIIGGAAGLAVAGGGATAGILIHKKHKKVAENQAPIEEAGAEKVDAKEAATNDKTEVAKEETTTETKASEEKSESHEEPQQQTTVAEEKSETNEQPKQQEAVPQMQQSVGNMNIPNPAIAYAQQMGMNLNQGMPNQFNPMYMNSMSGPMVGVPQMPIVPEMPIQQEQPTVEPEQPTSNTVEADTEDKITAADVATGTVEQKINNSAKKKNKK